MQKLIVFTTLSAAVLAQPRSETRLVRSEPVLVRAVLDGDTIDVATVGRVRLLGIDAPEVAHAHETAAPFGPEARTRLTALVLHRWVRLESEGRTTDVYNRRLAYVLTEDGQCANVVLVREGLARVSARQPLARLDELRRAEHEAQSLRRGMWAAAPRSSTSGGGGADATRRARRPGPG